MSEVRQPDWLSIREAIARILDAVPTLEPEEVLLEDAFGRTLAESVSSPIDQPPWDNSAMDGFAVRSEDVRGATRDQPRALRIVQSIAAGEFPDRAIGPGETARVMTGAPVPEGADGVIRVEHATATATHAEIFDGADAGRNVRYRGEDLARGAEVLRQGTLLRAGEIGVLATVGRQRVNVFRRARVGLLSTGNELTAIDQFDSVLAGKRIVDSNSYSLSAAVLSNSATPVRLGIARDDVASLEQHLTPALQLDALITTAGASVGEHDLVKDVLERIGMRTLFWRVRIRPGSPFSFGRIARPGMPDLPVFGLPGNPVSALVTFEVLVKPALRKMQGRAHLHSRTMMVRAAERIRSPAGLVRFLRVTLERQGADVLARLTGNQGSGILSSVARADALLVVPIDVDTIERGEEAVALPLASPDDAQDSMGF